MRKDKYKIAIFSHSTEHLDKTIKSAISLANIINGEIALFLIMNPTKVVREESQLSAIRSLSHKYIETDKTIRSIINDSLPDFGKSISYSFCVGNVKNEIKKYLKDNRPDVIVLKKRKLSMFDFLGDNTMNYVLQHHLGPIFIANNNIVLEEENISMALLNNGGGIRHVSFADNLLMHTQKTIKSFTMVPDSDKYRPYNEYNGKKIVDFVFEKRDDSFKNLSNYLSINNINLLCVNRPKDDSVNRRKHSQYNSNIKNLIANLNVPILLTGEHNFIA